LHDAVKPACSPATHLPDDRGRRGGLTAVTAGSSFAVVERSFYVYILASRRNGTLYVGVTSDLARRVYEHRSDAFPGFTAKYDVKRLVWYELHGTADEAISQEKRIKRWRRAWKLDLIERFNPQWLDLYETLNQ
jgi:putative endonuclease